MVWIGNGFKRVPTGKIFLPSIILLFAFLISIHQPEPASAQLAAVYSNVSQSTDCASWSSWGQCVWPSARTKKYYLDQLSPLCRDHWFFKFIGQRYKKALNDFFDYFLSVMKTKRPCGLCSYRQSCGFGGKSQCNLSPFEIPGGRSVFPFYVAEKVCGVQDLKGHDQSMACTLNYDILKENGGECKLWPTAKVRLDGIEPNFRQQILSLKWYSCLPQLRRSKYPGPDGTRPVFKVCRCCCFPFQPNPKTFECEHTPGAPLAPGFENIQEQEGTEENFS